MGPLITANSRSFWERYYYKTSQGRGHRGKGMRHGFKLQKGAREGLPPMLPCRGKPLHDIFDFLRTTCSISSTKLPQTSPFSFLLWQNRKHWPQDDSLGLNRRSPVYFQPDKDSWRLLCPPSLASLNILSGRLQNLLCRET